MNTVLVALYLALSTAIVILVPSMVSPYAADYGVVTISDSAQAVSVFQGNVGTAYRQRAQLLVFYFIFAAVGYVLMIKKREEKKKRDLAENEAGATRFPAPALTRVKH